MYFRVAHAEEGVKAVRRLRLEGIGADADVDDAEHHGGTGSRWPARAPGATLVYFPAPDTGAADALVRVERKP